MKFLKSHSCALWIYCIHFADNEELVRQHARESGFPANRISAVRLIIDPSTARATATV